MEKTSEKMRRAVVPVSMAVENEEEPARRPDPVWIREKEKGGGAPVAFSYSGDAGEEWIRGTNEALRGASPPSPVLTDTHKR